MDTLNLLALNTTFSQAPGTQLSFMCASGPYTQIISTICQETGVWKPHLKDMQCHVHVTESGNEMLGTPVTLTLPNIILADNFTALSDSGTTTPHHKQNFGLYILYSLIAFGLIAIVTFISVLLCYKINTVAARNTTEIRHEHIYEMIGLATDEAPYYRQKVANELQLIDNNAYNCTLSNTVRISTIVLLVAGALLYILFKSQIIQARLQRETQHDNTHSHTDQEDGPSHG